MRDEFQAEPPRRSSSELPPAPGRYSEINFRKPDKQKASGWWLIIVLLAAFLSVGLILAKVFLDPGYNPKRDYYRMSRELASARDRSTNTATTQLLWSATNDTDSGKLRGTWIATAVTIDGEVATDEDVAKVRLRMDKEGFWVVLPTTIKIGDRWYCRRPTLDPPTYKPKPQEIIFVSSDGADMLAIYELKGDTLKICWSQHGVFPTDFTARKDSKRTMLVLKRKAESP